MAQSGNRINEDIRFYLPADPYYYQVDNLPLEDLLDNDVRLQLQIDELNSADGGNTVGRAGFTELQPFIDAGLPGTVSVKPGNFIGRAQRTSGNGLIGFAGGFRMNNGQWEVNYPPTDFGEGENPTGSYSVSNPPTVASNPGDSVGRNSVFNFKGGNVTIESFNFDEFQEDGAVTPPLARLDLIGITTMNGAMDDPYLPGSDGATGAELGDGHPKLAVVKGAGITTNINGQRQVVIGEKFITVGTPQEHINDFGRNLEGDVVPNPEFGTTPMPDDVVNVNFARDLLSNGEIGQELSELAYSNKNGSFFLPIAYVLVPQSHVEGNPIPRAHLKDIRPFFRTAELSFPERQAIIGSISPSIQNPFVTQSHQRNVLDTQVNWDGGDPVQDQLSNLLHDVIPNMVIKDFQYKLKNVRSSKYFDWQIMIVNGMWIGHARAQTGHYAGTWNFPVYEWGLDNQGGVESAIAMGSFYNVGDIEEGNNGYSVGAGYTGNRANKVFTLANGLTFRWSLRSVHDDGDRVYCSATVIGKARENFNLAAI